MSLAEERRSATSENPDIELTADVKARELRFEEVPDTKVHPASQTERENLPEEVQPDVTYHNARVRLRISSEVSTQDTAFEVSERRSDDPDVNRAGSTTTSGQEKHKARGEETE